MHKTAIQFLAFVVAIALGFGGGFYWANRNVTTHTHEKENKELLLKVDSLRENMRLRDIIIAEQDSLAQLDSIHIVKILDSIKKDKITTEKERKRVNSLPTNEKVTWLYDYFGIK